MENIIQGIFQGIINVMFIFLLFLIMKRIEADIIALIKKIDDVKER